MANILTNSDAAAVLRCDESDANMLALLPQVDVYIRNATGHDWAADSPVIPEAKTAARLLLVQWHENPGMISTSGGPVSFGLLSVLVQLEAIALRYKLVYGAAAAGGILLPGVFQGDTVASVTGLVGLSGDQAAKFESVISVTGQIQQISNSNLTGKVFRAYIIPVETL